MEKQIVVLLKELEKATYGDENSRHNNHPDAFAFKNLAQEIFRVGYTLYEDKNNAPKYNIQLFYDLERKLMRELEILCQEQTLSDKQLLAELEPKYISLCDFF